MLVKNTKKEQRKFRNDSPRQARNPEKTENHVIWVTTEKPERPAKAGPPTYFEEAMTKAPQGGPANLGSQKKTVRQSSPLQNTKGIEKLE